MGVSERRRSDGGSEPRGGSQAGGFAERASRRGRQSAAQSIPIAFREISRLCSQEKFRVVGDAIFSSSRIPGIPPRRVSRSTGDDSETSVSCRESGPYPDLAGRVGALDSHFRRTDASLKDLILNDAPHRSEGFASSG